MLLHDSSLEGVLSKNGQVILTFSKEGKEIMIRLENVAFLIMNDFLLGNIVLDAEVAKIADIDVDVEFEYAISEGFINENFINNVNENDLYFKITPTYGCELQVICKEIKSDNIDVMQYCT